MKYDHSKLHDDIARMAGKKVLVIGDLMVDHYLFGAVSRISPEAPIPVVDVTQETWRLGGAANVAVNIAALGGSVTLCGVAGNDMMGKVMKRLLGEKGIDASAIVEDPSRPTTQKTRVIAHSQQVVRVDREKKSWLDGATREALIAAALKAAEGCQAILFSDYAKGVLTQPVVSRLIEYGKAKGIVLSVDPKPTNIGIFKGSTIITPNAGEAAAASGIALDSESNVEAAGRKLLGELDCASVLITRGEHGMSLFEKGKATAHVPTRAQEVFDVTGAGDTVIATLTLALAAGLPTEEAAYLANAAAGIVVGEVGVAAVTPQELESALSL
jgi:D-beta-D-heptose 7-phosphate kinase/D-beta-D-heptose 1-phosphate adenosyltransferase